ncbi:baseplate J/gp47 family protein [uncultured Rhodoblastus sp.]|uniref:baseplate J/gp47 family protein n=1 Tax=uncultured Rhodoblastus sp. TaxID=543037 RepID=UPI0025CED2C0|nr:baseplate J/gp47 family protein [uncultured Rhodoblastus sp.]
MTDVVCPGNERREAVRALKGPAPLNGIDFVESIAGAPPRLSLHFLHPLTIALARENFTIAGGVRIAGLTAIDVSPAATIGALVLTLTLSAEGDRSTYEVRVGNAPPASGTLKGLDPQLSAAPFAFHPECVGDFDCAPKEACPPPAFPPPQIDYLARDYAALRRQLFDRVATLAPGWTGGNPADIGVMILETLAYAGDYLSYRQDAVVTEAYLSTARLHASVKRHGRLVDYQMHSGHNARVFVQIRVRADALGGALPVVPRGARLLTDQPGLAPSPNSDWIGLADAVRQGAGLFETMDELKNLYVAHNEMPFHAWGASECCLPRGATRATLRGAFPNLAPGDILILMEARGPRSGDPADADVARRQAVRLLTVDAAAIDPIDNRAITEIAWHPGDALAFPLCVASREQDGKPVNDVSFALGNIVLADHGRTIGPPFEPNALEPLSDVPTRGAFRPRLAADPVTFATPPLTPPSSDPLRYSARDLAATDPRRALPEVTLESPLTPPWTPRLTLLESDIGAEGRCFVVEAEPDVGATLRLGDGVHGRAPEQRFALAARYRVGNGRVGNVGADALHHLLIGRAEVERVWNPTPATGGVDPESIDEARQKIPYAYRTQQRAVTAADYASEAMKTPGVQRAAARIRWTGSWHTVFVTIDPMGGVLTEDLRARVLAALEEKRMAGHDLEIRPALLTPLAIAMDICVAPNRYRADARAAVLGKLTSGLQPDGTPGLFHPDRLVMGERFYLSPLYAAAQEVDGVIDARVTRFAREDRPQDAQGLIDGYLTPGATEAFSIANDPNFPEHGAFTLTLRGGL